MKRQQFIEALGNIVGSTHVLVNGDLSSWEQDWRKRIRGKSLAVVRPVNVDQVSAIVRLSSEAGYSIVTQGGNTGLVAGSIPDDSDSQVVLSMQRMNTIRSIDIDNLTMTLEAGCILQSAQEAAEVAGYFFPLSLGAEGSCTIGGNLATNAGGTSVLRYGNARDLCLGLEVVTADGDIWHGLSGLRKDNTGYDLRNLMIGSEGTLGIITAATVKIYPKPAAILTAWAAVPSIDAAVELLRLCRQYLSADLTGFELINRCSLCLVNKHYPKLNIPFWEDCPYCVLLENSDDESEHHANSRLEHLFELAIEQGCVVDAVVSQNISQSNQFWLIRESITLAQASEGLNIKHDVSIPISSISNFVEQTDAKLKRAFPGIRLVTFGHLGDGNLHYNIQAPDFTNPADFIAQHENLISQLVYESVKEFSGSISAEHGIGALKVDILPLFKDATALRMMRSIRYALDPKGLFNPRRVIR